MAKYYIMRTGRDENYKTISYEKVLAHKTRLGTAYNGSSINGDLCYTIAHSEHAADELLAYLNCNGPMPKIDGGY